MSWLLSLVFRLHKWLEIRDVEKKIRRRKAGYEKEYLEIKLSELSRLKYADRHEYRMLFDRSLTTRDVVVHLEKQREREAKRREFLAQTREYAALEARIEQAEINRMIDEDMRRYR
jgi:hypothetical protein